MVSLLVATSFQAAAAWRNSSTTNEWTDEQTQFAADSTQSVFVSCDDVFLNFNSYMKGVNDLAFIKIRIDKNETTFTTGTWQETFANVKFSEMKRRGIIEQMKKGSTMIFGAGDYRDKWHDKKISLDKFTKSLEKMNCK